MDPYDSGEEEAVWILGQSVEGQGTDMNSKFADHEDREGGEEGSEEQNLGLSESETVHQNAPNYTIQSSNSHLLLPIPLLRHINIIVPSTQEEYFYHPTFLPYQNSILLGERIILILL